MASTSLRRKHTKRCGMPCAKLHDRATAPRGYRGTRSLRQMGRSAHRQAAHGGLDRFRTSSDIAVSGSIPTRACGEAEPCRRRSVPSSASALAGTETMLNSITCSMKSMPPGRLLVFRERLHLGSEADAGCPQSPFPRASLDPLGEAEEPKRILSVARMHWKLRSLPADIRGRSGGVLIKPSVEAHRE